MLKTHSRLVLLINLIGLISGTSMAKNNGQGELKVDDLFPYDRVLDVQITVDSEDWDTIRYQSRNFFEALHESRQYAPIDHPYTYVEASVSIDGVEFPGVGIRKKGFIGSQNSTRPSLKIKLNHLDKEGQIDGLTNLTFNNNQQDVSLISQFMGYGLFNAAGLPAPRCTYANLTVNGQDLGIYAHVERVHRPLLKRAFGNDNGVLYEGTAVDFYPGWLDSFEHKLGSDKDGREKIQQLIDVLNNPDENIESSVGELVDLESFYTFWAMEGLLSFWDGYSGNRNNFFIYLNPETDKFHFIPWGADSLFERYSPIRDDRRDPVSVKTQGLISNRLYQMKSGRQRYRQALEKIMAQNWDDTALLAETERIEALIKPYLAIGDKSESNYNQDEARGWIEWARNASPEERKEAINSEKFRNLSPKIQEVIIEGIDNLKEVERKGESSRKVGKDKVEEYNDAQEEKGQPKQLVYRFNQSLEERRQFIRQRHGDITEEIAKGMPIWEAKPADPAVIPSFDDLKPKGDSIWSAAAEGNLNAVKKYLAKGIDINAKGGSLKSSALLSATLYDQVKVVEFLIQNGADVNAKGEDGGTALHAAAFLGQYTVTKLLIQNGADVNARNNDGETVISGTMADWETTKFIAGMLQLKLDRERVENGRDQIVELLRQNGSEAEFSDPTGNDIWTMAGAGNVQAVKEHLAKGIDVDAKNKDGSTALHIASLLGQYEVAELLIQKGADVNTKGNDGATSLHAAAFLGQYREAKLLLENGVNANTRKNDGATAIDVLNLDWRTTQFFAQMLQIRVDREKVEGGRNRIKKLLGQKVASLDNQSDRPAFVGQSIHEAVVAGNLEVIKQHVDAKTDLNQKDPSPEGKKASALHLAAIFGQLEIAEALIKAGADPNQRDKDGSTTVHAAAFFGHDKILLALLNAGAHPNQRDNTGATALNSVLAPWDTVKGIYDFVDVLIFKPLGKPLDISRIKSTRPMIVKILKTAIDEKVQRVK
ncbi:MAG: CotH kinase family protein [Candidatus Poribacteria bacterium]|nr:CotH kinase family protein [Candidatus Poribacteria bacterium]